MFIPNVVFGNKVKYWCEGDYEDNPEHVELREHLCKSLYYGRMPTMDRPSLAMTELAVEMLQDVAPKEFGRVDMDWAAAVSRDVLMSPTSLMLGMTYAKRLKKKDSPYRHRISSSDLFLVSVMMASKFLYDEGEEDGVINDEWAASAHMEVDDLNQLERNFLAAMDWELFVDSDEFWASLLAVEQQIALRQASRRGGSFTYTDLAILSDSCACSVLCRSLCRLLLEVCQVVVVCSAAYIAGVAVIIAVQPIIHIAVSIATTLPPIITLTASISTTVITNTSTTAHLSPASVRSDIDKTASWEESTPLSQLEIREALLEIPDMKHSGHASSSVIVVTNFLRGLLAICTETVFGTVGAVTEEIKSETGHCQCRCSNQTCYQHCLSDDSSAAFPRHDDIVAKERLSPSISDDGEDMVTHHCRLCGQHQQQCRQHQKFPPVTAEKPIVTRTSHLDFANMDPTMTTMLQSIQNSSYLDQLLFGGFRSAVEVS